MSENSTVLVENEAILTRRIGDYVLLTKPAIVALLLLTTLCGMILGASGMPPADIVVLTLLGGALTAGGAGALNQYVDRSIDRKMVRTRSRPLADDRISPKEGLIVGLVLSVAGVALLAVGVNLLSALLAVIGLLYYVIFYTIFLKPKTPSNIVIGGGAGAMPPLVGWAAATGSLTMPALFLFALIFLWTPPHFWALALLKRTDYERADIPMLPVIQGSEHTRWQILLYSVQVVALTLLMPLVGFGGLLFIGVALVLGIGLIHNARKLRQRGQNRVAWRMYRYSSMYLAGIMVALMIDALIIN
ncbi:MAG: heme o synthase [Anaerolineales bacterium]